MKIIVGCEHSTFKEYYKTCGRGELGDIESKILMDDPSHCILWVEGEEILGHVLWHECSIFEHRKGYPRDNIDRKILKAWFERNSPLIELHEVWLKEQYRGKGYGWEFFEYFEEFILKKGYNNIVYYADHPAAITICRKRGYRETFDEKSKWSVFGKSIE